MHEPPELPKRIRDHIRSTAPERFPLRVYDLGLLNRRMRELRAALPAPFAAVLPLDDPPPGAAAVLAEHADGFDTAASDALAAARHAAPHLPAVLRGPGKTEGELAHAVELARDGGAGGVLVLADSPDELRVLQHCARRAGAEVDVLLGADRAGGAGMDDAALVACGEVLRHSTHLRARGFAARTDAAEPVSPLESLRPWASLLGVADPLFLLYRDASPAAPPWPDPMPPAVPGERVALVPPAAPEVSGGWFAAPVLDVQHRNGRGRALIEAGPEPAPGAGFAVVPLDGAWRWPWPRPELAAEPVAVAARRSGGERPLFPVRPVPRMRVGDVVAYPLAAGPSHRPPAAEVHCLPAEPRG